MNSPEYVKVNDKKYKINTDFRTAIECTEIAESDIGDLERALAILYKLYGDEGIDNPDDWNKLLELGIKYLNMGRDLENDGEPDMDFGQDINYIEASFMSDYNIDLTNSNMHWWKFYALLEGLSNSELGNCCVLNRIRNLRNLDVSKIKDNKERTKLIEAKKRVSLKRNEVKLTKEQEESIRRLDEIIGRR